MKIPPIRLVQLQFILCNDWARLYGMVKSLNCVQLFVTPWTIARQAPPSMGFSRQEYWSGLPFPSPGDLPDPGIELGSSALQADSVPAEPPGNPIVWYRCSLKLWKWVSSARDGVSLEELISEGWSPGLPNIRGLGDEEQLEKEAEKSVRWAENQEAVDGRRKKEVPGGGRGHLQDKCCWQTRESVNREFTAVLSHSVVSNSFRPYVL